MFEVFIEGDGADGIGDNTTRDGVLDVCSGTTDGGIDVLGSLERTVAGCVECAVFKGEAIDIAKRLFASDMAAHET